MNIDFRADTKLTGGEGKIHKQCGVCNGFKELSEFEHKTKTGRLNKTCRRCLDRSCKYHMKRLIMFQNNIIADDLDESELNKR